MNFDSQLDDNFLLKSAAENLLSLKSQNSEQDLIKHSIYAIVPSLIEENEDSGRFPSNRADISYAHFEGRSSKRKAIELEKIPSANINLDALDCKQWRCNICKEALFSSFSDACLHEASCKVEESVDESCKSSRSENCHEKSRLEPGKLQKNQSIGLSLIPETENTLSDYNHLLTQHIELFEIKANHSNGVGVLNVNDVTTNKIGLRCIHCAHTESSSTVCTFFPSAVSSIASGIGTIGARHLSAGKCENLSTSDVEILQNARKTSQQQTRMQGRVGLDVYIRDLAKRRNILDQDEGGIYIARAYAEGQSLSRQNIENIQPDFDSKSEISVSSHQNESDTSSFVQGDVDHFWECKYCKTLPVPWRASGSVIYSGTAPSTKMIEKHSSMCQGANPLPIPRNAIVEISESNETSCAVRIIWNTIDNPLSKSDRNDYRSLEDSYGDPKESDDIYEGVEDFPLALPEDEDFTTEFAFYTVKQLKKCFLTKSCGSRGGCPLGYAGLACAHCAGSTNERRFFYTSSDHLRNSFSHIPAHIITCSLCPEDVKTKIEALKCIRNKQKSLLKVGLHKIFIDRVWERLHGPGGGNIHYEVDQEVVEDEASVGSICTDLVNHVSQYNSESSDLEAELESVSSALVKPLDRNSTTDYTIFCLLQLVPSIDSLETISSDEDFMTREHFETDIVKKEQRYVLEDTTCVKLSCKYCVNRPEEVSFKINSPDDIRTAFPDIPDHLLGCPYVSKETRSKLCVFKAMRASQESQIKYSTHRAFMKTVWMRIQSAIHPPLVTDHRNHTENKLVSHQDRDLVSDYTFFTMLQMKPCYLDRTGNGARSMFEHGFPGLACIHCAESSSPRTFFYRTAEILAGNYAHIPNHLLSCKHFPSSLKLDLQDKKRAHMAQRVSLNRGSQRLFFNNIWDKLHRGRPS